MTLHPHLQSTSYGAGSQSGYGGMRIWRQAKPFRCNTFGENKGGPEIPLDIPPSAWQADHRRGRGADEPVDGLSDPTRRENLLHRWKRSSSRGEPPQHRTKPNERGYMDSIYARV